MFKIELMCEKGKEYQSQRSGSSIQRETGTVKTDCPFGLVANYYKTYDIWRLRVQLDEHNHPYAPTLEGHPYAMRLEDDEFHLVEELSKYNVQPRYILSTIKARNPDNVSSVRNVYNAQTKIRAVIRGDRTQIQLLLSHLTRTGYAYYERVNDQTNELEELFFVHPTSYAMTQSNNLIDYIPEIFRPHIFRINNVEGDGNCGFRSVAVGIDLRENMWPAIRQNLLQALDNYEMLFTEMWLGDGFQRIRHTVDHFGLRIAPRDKWMCMPDTGLVIASLYNQPVIFISPEQSNTCFPLWHGPDRPQPKRPIVIALVGGIHYINLTLYENSPIPPNHPQWRWYASGNAPEGEEYFKIESRMLNGINKFNRHIIFSLTI
ncbi:FAR1-related sequence 5-like protein [Tanacetum coccineum]